MYRLRQSNSTATLRFGRLSVSMGCSVAPDLLMSRFAARYGRFHLRHTMITSRAPSPEPAFQDKHTSSYLENCSKLFGRRSGRHFPTAPIPNPLRLKSARRLWAEVMLLRQLLAQSEGRDLCGGRSLPVRSGHDPAAKTSWLGRNLTHLRH
jgi:hypothetical protein